MAGITITLSGNFSKLDDLKDKAHKTANSIKSAFSSDLGKAAMGGLAAGAAAAFAGVVASVKNAIDAGGRLNDMMARTGAAGKGLVVMQQAFKNVGLSAESVPTVINRMQKALAGVNEDGEATNHAFGKLGLAIEELRAMDPVRAFQQVSASIASIEDPALRAATAIEIFGRSGAELLPIMSDASAFAAAREQVGSLAEILPGVAGEFDSIGDAMGAFDAKVETLGTRIAVALLPHIERLSELLTSIDMGTFDWTDPFSSDLKAADKDRARQMAEDWASDDPMHGKSRTEVEQLKKNEQGKASAAKLDEEREKEQKKAAKAAAQKAEAEAKSAAEKEKTRTAAQAEYDLEAAILSARIQGDQKRLDFLTREKAIREEIRRLESAGFTPEEARRPAEAKVDAEKKAADIEEKRKQSAEDQKTAASKVRADLSDVARRQEGLQYQSSIGAISAMQRIGGGGGAVASGLDYQRQAIDLQREATDLLRQLVSITNRDPEV